MSRGTRTRAPGNAVSGDLARLASIAVSAERLTPPANLNERERSIFSGIIAAREAVSWSAHDLNLAAILAKTMRHLESIESELDASGYTVEGRTGTRANPLLSGMLQCSQSAQALSRALGLSASQRALTGKTQHARNAADTLARRTIERAASDGDLIG